MKITTAMRGFLVLASLSFSLVTFAQSKTKTIQSDLTPKKEVSEKFKKAFEQVSKETDISELRRLQLEYLIEHTAIKSNVASYALLHNIERRIVQEDKTMELQRVLEDGTLIYFETYNVAAAISTRADYLNSGGGLGLALDGDGLTANVWDGGHGRITHNEYDGTGGNNRLTLIDTGSEGGTQLNFHAAHVTGTIIASGEGGQPNSKGMAWRANVRGAMWNNDVNEAAAEAAANMLVSNHSYGFGAPQIPDAWFGAYLTESEAWDNIMHAAPYYLMVVAAGNDGADNGSNGAPLNGNSSYDKLSGHSVSKNNLVVANGRDANINGDGSLNTVTRNGGSSEGPSDDLRIKPDIMGNGTQLFSTYHDADNSYNSITGTSMASPNVAGTLLLLQEHYNDLNGSFMRAATLKGIALHTADDVEPSNTNNAESVSLVGPDATTGWGLLNAKKAAETLTTAAAASGSAIVDELTLAQGQSYQIMVQSNGTDPLQASISWTDPEGNGFAMTVDGAGNPPFAANANNPTLVNDLDILVEQGATDYTPWRMTGVNTNGTGDNSTDPYERVDVNGASGVYTITVSHKGVLSEGPQNYSLIVTGVIVASVPEIAFSTLNDSEDENSDCGFTEYIVPLTIALAPSMAADVNFTVNGSSTATEGVDFELFTPSVTFGTSGTTSQNMILHVYHDDVVEGSETIIVDFTVNANGGNAVANTNADTFTLTLNDDDNVLIPTENVTLFSDGFETYTDFDISNVGGWTMLDNDGNTTYGSPSADWLNESYTGTFIVFNPSQTNPSLAGSAFDAHSGDKGYYCFNATNAPNGTALNDDYIFTPQIDLSSGTGSELTFWAKSVTDQYGLERFRVGVSTTNTNPGNFTFISAGSFEEAPTAWTEYTYDLSAYDGMNIYVTIQVVSADAYAFMLDDIAVTSDVEVAVQTAVNTSSPDLINIKGNGTSVALDANTGNVMAQIVNNAADDYDCVTVAVNRAGTGAQGYNGSTGANRVMDKRFTMSSINAVASGNVTSTFYFTTAEISGWETATGSNRNELVIARESSGVIQETVAVTEGTFGSNITLSGTFSEISDTYYFGPIEAFNGPCSGVLKTWTAAGWSPSGTPTTNDMVEINNSSYNWALGDIESCTLKVNTGITFTIPAGNYIKTEGNIVVDGTLVVAHQGSVVQTDPTAQVIKNGTINVIVTTPVLQTRDFSIMGSPMTAETRDGVWNTPFLVLGFTPGNFMPHDDVPTGGTNWADDNGDFYNTITGGAAVTPGEGYIVRPQDSYTDPANESYTFNYSQGTLNNGNISYTATNNGPVDNPSGTPHVVANPYPSAIDSDMFMMANGLTALYFWEHLTPPGTGLPGSNMRFDMEDISIRNMGMGMPAGNDAGNLMGTEPNNVISTAQGFGVRTNGADGTTQNITFTNTMRLTSGNTTLRRPSGETESILLEVRNAAFSVGGFAGLAFTENATNDLDAGYDTNRLATVTSLYSHLDDATEQLGIQSRGIFNDTMTIPFGFATQATEALEYSISLTSVTGSNVSEATIYLYDTLLDIETNLTEVAYTFTANEGVQDNRFVVYFQERMVLGTNDIALDAIKLFPNPTVDVITITSPRALITTVTIRDIQGRVVLSESSEGTSNFQVDLSTMEAAVYFAEITSEKGTVTKRIIKK